MRLIEHLDVEQKTRLRALRKRLRAREHQRLQRRDPDYLRRQQKYMRRYRADLNRRTLCPGVDLPGEGSTCGKLISVESNRCISCHNRRQWLVRQYNLGELRVLAQLIHAEEAYGHDVHHLVTAALQDVADGIELQGIADVVDGIESEQWTDDVQPHAVRRAHTPGAGHRPRITLAPLPEDWDAAASGDDHTHVDRCLSW